MKHLKLSALGLIALFAMSFTAVKSHKHFVANCFTSVTVNGTPYNQDDQAFPPANGVVTAKSGPINSTTCSGTGAFCCATVKTVGTSTEIDQVFQQSL